MVCRNVGSYVAPWYGFGVWLSEWLGLRRGEPIKAQTGGWVFLGLMIVATVAWGGLASLLSRAIAAALLVSRKQLSREEARNLLWSRYPERWCRASE